MEKLFLNQALLKSQNISREGEAKLLELHNFRLEIENAMDGADQENLEALRKAWTGVQFLLQDAWGFERDSHFHGDPPR